MMLKKYFKVGETVECMIPNTFPINGTILEVEAHLLEYDRIYIECIDCPVDDVRLWVSERDCIRKERAVSA